MGPMIWLVKAKFQITNSVICDLCQMKLNREELANTSFDQINFNEWRLWFFKEFVKMWTPGDLTVLFYLLHSSHRGAVLPATSFNSVILHKVPCTHEKRNYANSCNSILTKFQFFPLSYSLIIFDNLLNEGNKSIYRYSLAYKYLKF